MSQTGSNSYEISLGEYETAALNFFNAGVKQLMEAQGGVYSLVSKESIEQLPDYSLPPSRDDPLSGRLIEAVSDIKIDCDSVLRGDFDSVIASMYSVAIEFAGQISNSILAHISDVCESTGNVVTVEMTHDALIDMIERTDFSFDDAGNPNGSFVANPEMMQKIQALGKPSAEQQARADAITERKRREWNARRSSRSLPSRRLRT
jgi:hypothetical protein